MAHNFRGDVCLYFPTDVQSDEVWIKRTERTESFGFRNVFRKSLASLHIVVVSLGDEQQLLADCNFALPGLHFTLEHSERGASSHRGSQRPGICSSFGNEVKLSARCGLC